ncbi:hypothetical protein [Xanthomonas sp. SHU 308]|uniref:hypothetical protein n=1 Tax=Xanthomonas sp. SHU 308 TaxID=1591201 RepID=UPI0012FF5846|nr:hypothetical protein [Xanthomonas sp. SHU 308]
MTKPAFLVDGQTEKLAIQLICPGRPIRVLGLNGNTVSAAAIAKRAKTHIDLLKGRCFPFILIADLEDRKLSHEKFATEIANELVKLKVSEPVIIGIPDRMIENWIHCDPACVGQSARCCDGENGANLIKKSLGTYHKTTTGSTLLAQSRASELRKSPSFSIFADKLASLGCQWLNR